MKYSIYFRQRCSKRRSCLATFVLSTDSDGVTQSVLILGTSRGSSIECEAALEMGCTVGLSFYIWVRRLSRCLLRCASHELTIQGLPLTPSSKVLLEAVS